MKKLLLMLLSIAMVCTLSACSKNDSANTNEDGEKPVTISIWHTFTEGQEELLNTIANEYMDDHSNVTIEVVNTGAASEYQGKVTDSVINGVGPNLIFEFSTFAKSFDIEGADYLLSFEDYWDFDYKATLDSEGLYEEATNFSDGKLHIVPVYTAGAVLFCNQDIYDEAGVAIPTTWDEVKEASKTIYEKTGVVGLSLDSLADFEQLLIYQCNGGKIVDLDNKQALFNNANVLKWLQWWEEGVDEGYFQVAAQAADGYNSSDINNGLVASYIGSSAGLPYLTVKNLTVVRVPMISEKDIENAGIIWTRGAIGFDTGDEAENAATADFVKYFISQNERWVLELNANTPYKDVAASSSYQQHVASDKALSALADQIPYSFVAPVFTGATEMRNEITAMMKAAADPNFDAQAALENCANNVNAVLQGQ